MLDLLKAKKKGSDELFASFDKLMVKKKEKVRIKKKEIARRKRTKLRI